MDVRPNGIISTAMLLHDWQRTVIEQVFGCPVTNRYGCEEVSLIASECEKHQRLHVNADSRVTPRLPRRRQAARHRSVNRAMPLIRYQIGDVVVGPGRVCPVRPRVADDRAGRGPRGGLRRSRPAGNLISGISLTENFALLIPGAAQVQIVQESLTHLRIRLVTDDDFGDASRRQDRASWSRDTFGPACGTTWNSWTRSRRSRRASTGSASRRCPRPPAGD